MLGPSASSVLLPPQRSDGPRAGPSSRLCQPPLLLPCIPQIYILGTFIGKERLRGLRLELRLILVNNFINARVLLCFFLSGQSFVLQPRNFGGACSACRTLQMINQCIPRYTSVPRSKYWRKYRHHADVKGSFLRFVLNTGTVTQSRKCP